MYDFAQIALIICFLTLLFEIPYQSGNFYDKFLFKTNEYEAVFQILDPNNSKSEYPYQC